MEDAVKLAREFGFPTLFCLWLMWRDGKRTEAIVENMGKMLTLLSLLAKTVDGIDSAVSEEVERVR